VNTASERIENIVTGLRSFANIEKSALSDTFNLRSLFFEIENMLKGMYLNDGVRLEFDYTELADNVAIKGNRGKFEQILINLISNAKDSTASITSGVIKIIVKNHADRVLVSILDNGSGVPVEIKDKIFDPFFTTKEVGKGTGIGLSLVYRFVTDEFDGQIDLQRSGLGDGSQFDISLPASTEAQSVNNETAAAASEAVTHTSFKLKVILAEDEAHIRELLCEVLELAGIEVFACENGAIALDEYSKNANSYDLVISDMKMPFMDGLTLLKQIRTRVDLKQPKFFFITGGINIDFENSENEWFSTIDGYFYKPFNLSDVLTQLQKSFPQAFAEQLE
jgi:two-component system cell cycle sensor histidine kinase/response regulator CckA